MKAAYVLWVCAMVCDGAMRSATPIAPTLRTYTNSKLGISFRFPSELRIQTRPLTDDGRPIADVTISAAQGRSEDPDMVLHFCVTHDRHAMTNLWVERKYAPTGYDGLPPKPMRFESNHVFYYGEGGGGVYYPDQFFLRQRMGFLVFQFYGPKEGSSSKGPGTMAKALERTVLSSVRLLR